MLQNSLMDRVGFLFETFGFCWLKKIFFFFLVLKMILITGWTVIQTQRMLEYLPTRVIRLGDRFVCVFSCVLAFHSVA